MFIVNGLPYIQCPDGSTFAEIVTLLEKALPEHPEDEVVLLRNIISMSSCVPEKTAVGLHAANRMLEIATEADDKAEALIFKATTLREAKGDMDEAIALFTEAHSHNNEYQDPYENLFAIYTQRKEYETALHWATLMTKQEGLDSIGFQLMGEALTSLGKTDEALLAFETSLAKDESAEAYKGLGNCFLIQGNYAQAVEAFTKAHEKCHYPEPLYTYGVGYAYHQMDDPYRAMKWYAKTLDIDPSYANALNNMAVLNLTLSNTWEDAVPYLLKAVELSNEAINASMQVVYRNLWAYYTQILNHEKAEYYHRLMMKCLGFDDNTIDFLDSFKDE